jgi:SAM-dependent methyltransferase
LLPWEDNEFTVVVGIETFYFWQEPVKTLNEIFRVLEPGGRVVFEMGYNKEDGQDHSRDIEKINLTLYSATEMVEMLRKARFSEIEFTYFKGFWLPFKGYLVRKGMIVKATKN